MNRNKTISGQIAGSLRWSAVAPAALAALLTGCVQRDAMFHDKSDAPPPSTPNAAALAAANAAVAATASTIPAPPPVATTPTPAPPPPILPFDEAVKGAAHRVFAAAPAPDGTAAMVVIDPLVDGMTGYRTNATRSIQDRIIGVVKEDFPQYAVQRITPESLKKNPRILVGTFTPVNAQMKTTGQREAFRFCLVMGDLLTGKIIAKSVARVRIEDPDSSPSVAFADSPVWTSDPSVEAYVATCQASKVGDDIRPEYFDGLLAASLISEAIDAYESGNYADALDLFMTARKTPAGDQLRVYNGIYLAQNKLGNADAANAAFGDLVDYGIRKKRLAVKFLFRPGSVRFVTETEFGPKYPMWLQEIAAKTAANGACLQVTGHTSPTGPATLNDSLSLLRAEYIQSRLESDEPSLKKRTVAAGAGSRENLVGTGKDDETDMLDRRVELKPINPCG